MTSGNICLTKNVPAEAAVAFAAEDIPETVDATTNAASQGGSLFITSHGKV